MKAGKNGVTAKTPKNILFGAGTIHRGLKHEGNAWNTAASIVGATSGGSKFSIIPTNTPVSVDGVNVPTKGLNKKTEEKATMEVNFIELSKDLIKAATLGKIGTSEDTKYDLIESKADIEDGDYWDNIAFVGKTLEDDMDIIVIMDNALCTSGLDLESKAKEGSIGKFIFECNAELDSDGDTLPWHIYYPKTTA